MGVDRMGLRLRSELVQINVISRDYFSSVRPPLPLLMCVSLVVSGGVTRAEGIGLGSCVLVHSLVVTHVCVSARVRVGHPCGRHRTRVLCFGSVRRDLVLVSLW